MNTCERNQLHRRSPGRETVARSFMFLLTTISLAIPCLSQDQELEIRRYQGGIITFNQISNAAYYRVDWAPKMAGPWSGSWDSFQCIPPCTTNDEISLPIPHFYRVTAIMKGYLDRPVTINPMASVDYDELTLVPRGTNTTHHIYLAPFPIMETNVIRETVVDYDLWMGKYEVTYELYQAVLTASTAVAYVMNAGARGTGVDRQGMDASHVNQPVTEVNWYDALKFCNKLSELAGIAPVFRTGNDVFRSGEPPFDQIVQAELADGFRLPAEEEWEYCARGDLKDPLRLFPWGDAIDPTNAIYYYNVNVTTMAVGSYPAGIAGGSGGAWDLREVRLYDMAGNVDEWVWDRTGDPAVGVSNLKCGGAFLTSSPNLRCVSRQFADPSYVFYGQGFRICRSSR